MNIFDKRDEILSLQESMLLGSVKSDDEFLVLVKFENSCCNGGLSCFVQDYENKHLTLINNFGVDNGFSTVIAMIDLVKIYSSKYGLNLIEKISEEEFDDLSKLDDDFYDIQDAYTESVYTKYINIG